MSLCASQTFKLHRRPESTQTHMLKGILLDSREIRRCAHGHRRDALAEKADSQIRPSVICGSLKLS